jgi:hypothetical protein
MDQPKDIPKKILWYEKNESPEKPETIKAGALDI